MYAVRTCTGLALAHEMALRAREELRNRKKKVVKPTKAKKPA
jgi:hypothetical protein